MEKYDMKYLDYKLVLKGGIIILIFSILWSIPFMLFNQSKISMFLNTDVMVFWAGMVLIFSVGFAIIGERNGMKIVFKGKVS